MLPRVVLHCAASLDGRIDHLAADVGLYYELAGRLHEDATLVGCDTLLKAAEEIPPETEADRAPRQVDTHDERPLLVVPDSRGRLRSWHYWRGQPYWRGGVALCSRCTPSEHFGYLRERAIPFLVTGEDRVDLRAALEKLHDRHGVRTVRVDSGGALNGALLRAGLVAEVSVLLHPQLTGGTTPQSFFRAPDLGPDAVPVRLKLKSLERVGGDVVWMVHEVVAT